MRYRSYHDVVYLHHLRSVLNDGVLKSDRTGTGTKSLFGRTMRFNLTDGSIPLLTTKRMHTKSIIHELLWFLKGETNIRYLKENGVSIWDEWADENGELGPIYGKQWRRWEGPNGTTIDQIQNIIDLLKNDPDSRRILVNAWNVGEIDSMALPPCHYSFQFYTHLADESEIRVWESHTNKKMCNGARTVSCLLNMRSNDLFLGNPFNIAQYSILLRMVAEVVDMIPGDFILNVADMHLYKNHIEQAITQCSRKPFASPFLSFSRRIKDIDGFKYDDFEIHDYQSHPSIKAEVSV